MIGPELVAGAVGPWDAVIVGLNVAQVIALGIIANRSRRTRYSDTARAEDDPLTDWEKRTGGRRVTSRK